MIKLAAGVIAYDTKAVVPTTALTDAGFYFQVVPVACSDLSVDGLTAALRAITASRNPHIPALTHDEFKQRIDYSYFATAALRQLHWKFERA